MSLSLSAAVEEAFAAGGSLTQATDTFLPREAQRSMARAVADTIEQGGSLVVEAGTGVGKTFAYLVPALLSGERVLISTATKALQDQLFARDLPRLAAALGVAVHAALLKGRASYLCLHRLEMTRHDGLLPDRSSVMALARVEEWSRVTRTGDLAELPGLDERSSLIPLVTSTRDNCLGSECPKFRQCHVNQARREALAADVVVINHHLFFADLNIRESGMAELLPSVRVVVFDEAHQLNETGVEFLGIHWGTGPLVELARDMLATGLQHARGLVDWQVLAGALERSARDLRLLVGRSSSGQRRSWTDAAPQGVPPDAWAAALGSVGAVLGQCADGLQRVQDAAPDFARLLARVQAAEGLAQRFLAASAPDHVRWLEVSTHLRLVESPLDIADAVRARLIGNDAEASPRSRAWIFTSATLGDDERLSWFTVPCGLESARVLRVSSPFDYPRQAAVYVPARMPRPNEPAHTQAVAELAAEAVRRLGGRAMVLTTTLRALQQIGDALEQRLGDPGRAGPRIEVLVQGRWPKRRLIERFRAADADDQPGCVLVASASFWEGVDVPGDALQLVIIDKLPFPPPNEPLVQARTARLQAEGRNPFNDYFVPEAAVALKQGAGRLIRTESDQGVLVICDPRLGSMGYGRRLLSALPAMRRLRSDEELNAALDALREGRVTRASTTGPTPDDAARPA